MDIKEYLRQKKELVEQALEKYMLQNGSYLENHLASLRYSLFAGGKRIRPILCLAAAEAVGEYDDSILPIACALECIHTYSLIHDDLPAMDNDDLRRGKPTNHKMFGEAEAILAGDGLLTFAFDLMSDPAFSKTGQEHKRLQTIYTISRAAGSLGMVGGQSLDIASENKEVSFEILQTIHRCKTGALITASVEAGAIMAGGDSRQIKAMASYGANIGLAFQIVDDLLNVTSTTEQLGKAAGSDAERNKATYPGFFGVDTTRAKAKEAVDAAIDQLKTFDDKAEPLRELARYIYTRTT